MIWKRKRTLKQKYKRKKWNNAGMSLIEVIIAITMLSIVAIPVLRSMTSAMYYNGKARTRQSVTISAESLMETFKGYDLESLKSMFEQAKAGDVAARAELGAMQAEEFIVQGDLSDPTLNFAINGMQVDSGNTTCNIQITATRPADGELIELMEIADILPTRDAIYRADRSWDTSAYDRAKSDFVTNYQEAFLNQLNTLDEMDRELTINDLDLSHLTLYQRELTFNILNDGTNDVVTAEMVYTYYIKEYLYYEAVVVEDESEEAEDGEEADESEETEAESETIIYVEKKFNYPENVADYFTVTVPLDSYYPAADSGGYTIYRNPVDGGEHPLERIYLYYYPVYGLKDSILVKNNAGLSLDCYMIKQKIAGMSNIALQNAESSYKPTVSKTGSGNVTIYHNFGTNLGGSGTTQGADLSSFSSAAPYTGNAFVKKKALVYDLEIKVFQNGTEIASLTGTMNEYMD